MKVLSLLLGLLHLSGVACLQNKANRVADAEDKNVRSTTRSKSPHSATNGIDFGHPLLPPPKFDLVELYKAPESSKKGNNTHSHSIDFKGPAGEALRLSYTVQFEAGSTIVCLDHLSGIASGSAIPHKSAEKESVEVGFHLSEYAEILVDALESGVDEAALSTVYVTGGMHWGSKDHSDGSARPLLLKLGGFDRDGTTLRLWGSPVGYQHIFKNADIHISTNGATSRRHHTSTKRTSKSDDVGGVKPFTLVKTSERTPSPSTAASWWNPLSWVSKVVDFAISRTNTLAKTHENVDDVKSFGQGKHSEQTEIVLMKLSASSTTGSWWNPLSWISSAVDFAISMTECAVKTLGNVVSSILHDVGPFIWEIEKDLEKITSGTLARSSDYCGGWNLYFPYQNCDDYEVASTSIVLDKVKVTKGSFSGELNTFTCENCYAYTELFIDAKLSIEKFSLTSASLQGSGKFQSNLNFHGDIKAEFTHSNQTLLSKSIIGNRQVLFYIGLVPVYLGYRIPLSIGYATQVKGDLKLHANAFVDAQFQSGFTYNNGALQFFSPNPIIEKSGNFSFDGAVKSVTSVFLLPTIQLSMYKFTEADIALRPGLQLAANVTGSSSTNERYASRACPASKTASHVTTHEVLSTELLMSVSGGLKVEWPGMTKYSKMTKPYTMYHNTWPIWTHCNQYWKTQSTSLVSDTLEAPFNSISERYSPLGVHQGQVFGGIFSRLDNCVDDFMPKGQVSMTVMSVKHSMNGTSSTTCPEEFEVFISANDGTEIDDPDAHACVSIKKMKVRVTPRKDLNRCDLHFDVENATHVHKGCTQVKDKESSCNNFPKLAGSADTNFGIIRLHDEHLRSGKECIRGIMTRSNIQEAAAECQDSSDDLNAIASERGITGQYSCNDAREAGYCGDPDVAQACCNTCIATWLSQA